MRSQPWSGSEMLPIAAIAAVFFAGAALVGPMREAPVIDDWVYAWSVEHLLRTRELRVSDYSGVYPVAQILWGALFARVLGFSFGALRIATAVLGAAGCSAFYLTLRELRWSREASLLGALAIALDPVYFALSFSFMTDVPFTGTAMIALLFLVQGVERRNAPRLWVGTVFSVLAFLIRPIGIVLPIAAFVTLPWRAPRAARLAFPLVCGGAMMVAVTFVLSRTIGTLAIQSGRYEQLQWWFTVSIRDYAAWNVALLFEAVFPFTPLLLAPLVRPRTAAIVAVVAGVVGAGTWWWLGTIPPPLPNWETWSLQDIGARAMIGGDTPVSAWSTRVAPIVDAAGLVILAAFLVATARNVASWFHSPGQGGGSRGALLILAYGLLNAVLVNVLWLYNDRYYLVFAPAIAVIATAWASQTRGSVRVAAALLVLFGAVAVSGTRDMIDVNAAATAAARDLEAAGVPPWDIDAGYASNGWRLYVHPEHLRPGTDPHDAVPYVTSRTPTTYRIANRSLPDYEIVKVVPLPHAWWQATDRLYVMRRETKGGQAR